MSTQSQPQKPNQSQIHPSSQQPIPSQPPSSVSNISKQKPFRVLNLAFASRKVLTDFLFYSFMIIVIPIIFVFSMYNYVKDNQKYSDLDKIIVSVGPALFFINIIIGIYIYKVIKDPENYKRDQPLKPVIPVGFKEESMNRRKNMRNQNSENILLEGQKQDARDNNKSQGQKQQNIKTKNQ